MVRFIRPLVAALILVSVLDGPLAAQSPPTDLTELNLEEILALRIRRAEDLEQGNRWSVGYRFVWARFDGNRDGSDDVSLEDMIFRPGEEPRTRDNFPVVPLQISQQVHLVEVGFDVTESLGLRVLIPFVYQETDHCSVVPGFESFVITSSGIGDVNLSASWPVWNDDSQYVLVTGGFSLPLGSVDEKGRTPRDADSDTQLPYTMQTGSGTFDLTPGLVYSGSAEALRWGSELRGTLRLGENDRDYTLGNRLALSAWVRRPVTTWLEPSVTLIGQHWGRIDGEDTSLRVDTPAEPSPFPYPAAVTDPSKFGGDKVVALLGATLRAPGDALSGHALDVEFGWPAYQNLNGPQPKEVWRLALGWSWKL